MPVGDPPPVTHAAVGGPQGWECPRCHATYAPWVAACSECRPAPTGLRQRITEAQPPTPVFPVVPYVPPPVYPAPLFPAPQWPYQDRIVWCDTSTVPPTTYTLTLTPEARARMTMGSGALAGETFTLSLGASDAQPDHGDDDGTAGVPARA